MAKKTKCSLASLLTLAAVVLGLVAFFLMFAPAATIEKTDAAYTGANLTFGYAYTYNSLSIQVFKFSFMNFLTYILLIVAIVFGVLSAFGKLGKISGLVSAVCYLVAGIFFFCVIPFSILNVSDDVSSVLNYVLGISDKDVFSIGAGAIVSGVLSIVAALVTAASALVLKK